MRLASSADVRIDDPSRNPATETFLAVTKNHVGQLFLGKLLKQLPGGTPRAWIEAKVELS